MSEQAVCWIGGELMPAEKARVSVMDHGLLYGDGVFEGIRFYGGRAFLLEEHLRRLADSARAIALALPWSSAQLTTIVKDVIRAYGSPDGYLRILVTRGRGPLGINPASCGTPELIVIADRLAMVDEAARAQGIRAIIASTRRLPADGLDPRVKSLNYLNHILARTEANHAGVEEALMLNARGQVAEGTADNVFIVRDGALRTPPVTDGALAGITRGLVIRLARELGIEVQESSLAPYDLYTADECFLTGTGAELIPVREVDGRALGYCPGPVFEKLSQSFAAAIERHIHQANPSSSLPARPSDVNSRNNCAESS
ncbi:MAG: branched-chain-amino-acid transaminase [Gammaproteobacteria bacterium]